MNAFWDAPELTAEVLAKLLAFPKSEGGEGGEGGEGSEGSDLDFGETTVQLPAKTCLRGMLIA
jgi:hypothetical protein